MADNRDVQKRQPDVLADALQGLATPNKGKPLEAAYRRPKRMNKFMMLMIRSYKIFIDLLIYYIISISVCQ